MMTKKLIVLLIAAVFTLGVVGLSFSEQEVKRTVSKIEGNKLTIQEDKGKENMVSIKDMESLKKIKVGDKVMAKDGKGIKEST